MAKPINTTTAPTTEASTDGALRLKLKELALAGMSQAEAARHMGRSRQYIHQMAKKHGIVFQDGRAHRRPPSPEAIAKVLAAAGAKRDAQRAHDRSLLAGIVSDPRWPLIHDALTRPGKP
jgi:hypothetical protein